MAHVIPKYLLRIILVITLSGCTGALFHPMKTLIRTPADIGLQYEDVNFNSDDGTRLHGWFLPAFISAKEQAHGTILLLHGNAENISTHIGSVHWLPERGFNVFLFDYRGYGQSSGNTSITGSHQDITNALRWLLNKPGIDPKRVIVLGQSLGGVLGSYALAQSGLSKKIQLLILDSTFGNYQQIAREKFSGFWLTWPFQYPLSWTLPSDYNPIDIIDIYSPTPVLLIHGEGDDIIPIHHAQQLFAVAKEPKTFWSVPNAGHISSLRQPAVRNKLVDYLKQILDGES